jgi:hypothetical protein
MKLVHFRAILNYIVNKYNLFERDIERESCIVYFLFSY